MALPVTERVLSTAELLEGILLQLPMKDLLFAQEVCKSWQTVITHSVQLRRALFMEPAKCGPVSWMDWRIDDKQMYMMDLGPPLRALRGLLHRKPLVRYQAHWGKQRVDANKYRVFINPLLAKHFPVLTRNGVFCGQTFDDLSPAMQDPAASWRRMLITQPAIDTLLLQWDYDSTQPNGSVRRASSNGGWIIDIFFKGPFDAGITAEHMLKRLQRTKGIAWIEGSEKWKDWQGAGSLGNIVKKQAGAK